MIKKIRSLIRYRKLFKNWWIPALARYARHWMPTQTLLRFRDGRNISFRPSSDYVALGEIFVAGGYSGCMELAPTVTDVWDIGGNIGGFVVWASSIFPVAKFTSFDPCHATFGVLTATKAGNPLMNWQIHDYGLSSKDETCVAFVPGGHFGEASRFASTGQKVEFRLRDINKVWEEKGCPHLDLLKIDCEGGEYAILEGCSDKFLSSVDAIVMEVHPVTGQCPKKIKIRLESSGFECNWFEGSQGLVFARRRV